MDSDYDVKVVPIDSIQTLICRVSNDYVYILIEKSTDHVYRNYKLTEDGTKVRKDRSGNRDLQFEDKRGLIIQIPEKDFKLYKIFRLDIIKGLRL